MESFSLAPHPEWLREITQDQAAEIIKTILWKDLAYSSEMIAEQSANERAKYLVALFYDGSAKIYTNGDWVNYHNKRSCGSNPLTDSTFDAGVLFVGGNYAACIWVDDED
jgi:hypothetical protein